MRKNLTLTIILIIILSFSFTLAGTTGKITGIVTDSETGDPLIGCNVIIEGTDLGAATNIDGQYVILNIQPGKYNVRTSMIGYTDFVVQNVQVSIDLTTTVDFKLTIEVLGGEEVTIVAERPAVQMDLTSSEARVSSDQLELMPVTEVWDVISLQSGITKDAGGGIHIRGGRGQEIAYWVDGVSVTDGYDGGLSVAVDNNAIKELQVISGTFNAEYGQAMSGIINLVTKDGGQDYHGLFLLYGGSYASDSYFPVTPDTVFFNDKLTGLEKTDITNEQNLEASVSGPFPLLGKWLTFYGYLRKNKSDGWLNGWSVYDKYGNLVADSSAYKIIDTGGVKDTVEVFKKYNSYWYSLPTSGETDTTIRIAKKDINFFVVDTNITIVPMNQREKLNTNLKLTFKLNPRMKLRFSYMTSDEEYQSYNHYAQHSPEGELIHFNSGRNMKLNFTHNLSSRTFYTLDFSEFSKDYHHYAFESIFDTKTKNRYFYILSDLSDTLEAFKENDYYWYSTTDSSGNRIYTELDYNDISFTTIDTFRTSHYIDPQYFAHEQAVFPVSSFKVWGINRSSFNRKTTTSVAKFDVTSQVTPVHQVKFGAEYRKHDLSLNDYSIDDSDPKDEVFTIRVPGYHEISYDSLMNRWMVLDTVDNIFLGWDWTSNKDPDSLGFDTRQEAEKFSNYFNKNVQFGRRYYHEKLEEFSAYIQDKIEFKSVIINVGLRYDWFNPKAVVPMNPSEPYIGNPRRDPLDSLTLAERENINWTQYVDPNGDGIFSDGFYSSFIPDSGASLVGAKGWWKKTTIKQKISPRIGIAYPITDKGVIHFSFGHFFQVPSFERLFANPGYKIPETSGKFGIFGNPDLKPQKTVMYELGLRQEIFPGFTVDITGYYRDVRDWVSTGIPIKIADGVSYFIYVNKDYSNVRGLTLNIDKRFSNYYGFNINYTFQVAEGSNSHSDEEFGAFLNNEEPTRLILPLDWDQTHTVNGVFFLGMRNWNLSLLGQFGSGNPYTPAINIAATQGINTSTVYLNNSRRKPIIYNLDLNFIYTIPIRGIEPQLFIKVFNLLDRRNELTVYGDTGRANETLDIQGVDEEGRPNTIDEFYNRRDWYSAPRQIQLGIKFNF